MVWSLLVLIGGAQPILDFIFWAHMIKPVYFVKPFDPIAVVALIAITSVIGYLFGFAGSPVIDICGFTKDHDINLIITSTHGFTGFAHVLIGSIAEQVVRHAPCSVLVVPSHPHLRAANLAKSGGAKVDITGSEQQLRRSRRCKALTRKDRTLATHAFTERRKTNKFRESHARQ